MLALSDPQRLSVLVGHDDQTWALAISVLVGAIDDVVREVEACVRASDA